MNEQIKALLKESGLQPYYDDQTGQIEKFTKLIVQECVKVMYDNAIERKVPLDINYTPTHYAVAILEHFGVKE